MKRLATKRATITTLGVLSAFICLSESVAQARTITVNSTEAGEVNNQLCGLEEAVVAVNSQAPANPTGGNDCPAGDGVNDTIVLPAGTFPSTLESGVQIFRNVQILGAGMGKTTVTGKGIFVFEVASWPGGGYPSTIAVTMKDFTIRRDPTEALPVNGVLVESTDTDQYQTLTMQRMKITDVDFEGIDVADQGGFLDIRDSILDGIHGNGLVIFGALRMDRTAVTNNQETGIYFRGIGNSRIFNSTIAGNTTSDRGGGIWSEVANTGTFEIFNSTIARNHAAVAGGGIWEATTQSTPLRLYSSIIASNVVDSPTPGIPPTHDVEGSPTTLNSLIGNSTGLGGVQQDDILDVNAQLGALVDITYPIVTKVVPLLKTSPAIDKLSSVTSEVATSDARGYLRPIDGPDANTTAEYDIGAIEFDSNLQSEVQAVNAQTAGRTHAVISDGAYTNAKGTRFDATATSDFVTYAIPVAKTGSHTITAKVRKGNDRGIYQVAIAGSPSGPWTNLSTPQDLYASSQSFVTLSLGSVTIGSTGTKYVRFTVTGKNAGNTSSFRRLFLDWIGVSE